MNGSPARIEDLNHIQEKPSFLLVFQVQKC
jgi:hypothetical protein